jgi:deoxyribonuclease V
MKQRINKRKETATPCRTPTFSVEKAHQAQLQMSKKIILEDRLPAEIRLIAGIDVAYTRDRSIATAVILEYDTLKLVESRTAVTKTLMPYTPTLLSFREILPSILSIKKLHLKPDLFLVDGQGLAHPYCCGLASHLGLVIRRPTIGVAKSRLFGRVENAKTEDATFLKHDRQIIGAAVTTKQGSKPVYVSTGHMVSLKTAIRIVKACARDNRIPEPLIQAHQIANVEKRKIHIQSHSYD